MTDKNITITIVNNSSVWNNLIRIWAVFNGVVVPIGIGVLVQSTAMQWAGFILGLMIILAIGKGRLKQHRYTTVEAAKAALDGMRDRGEAP